MTSYDYVFAAAGALAALLLLGPARRGVRTLAGSAIMGGAVLLSWALLGVAAWAFLVRLRRDGVRAALETALACAAGVIVVNAVLAVGWGYDPRGALMATEQVYRDSISLTRPYRFWVVGSPVAWAVSLGIPIAALVLRALGAGRNAALALALIVLVAAAGGFTKAETERIWLFMVPLACVAAAPALGSRWVRPVLALLALQGLLTASLFNTVW